MVLTGWPYDIDVAKALAKAHSGRRYQSLGHTISKASTVAEVEGYERQLKGGHKPCGRAGPACCCKGGRNRNYSDLQSCVWRREYLLRNPKEEGSPEWIYRHSTGIDLLRLPLEIRFKVSRPSFAVQSLSLLSRISQTLHYGSVIDEILGLRLLAAPHR